MAGVSQCKFESPKFSEQTRTTLSSYRRMEAEDARAAGATLGFVLCEIGQALKSLVSGNNTAPKEHYSIPDHGKM